jgi:type I restriction enzyme S subunit
MKLETFFEEFDQFADAPDAIARMRELVLQLAVRGRLSEQRPSESAHAQLEIAEAFRIQRRRSLEINSEDGRFLVPDNWAWVPVGAAMDMINGKAFRPEEWSAEGTPIIRIQNLNNENAPFNKCSTDLDPKIHVRNGDFLISWSGTPGTSFGAFIWNRGFAFLNQHIFRCELVEGVFEKEYLRLAVNARLDEMISRAHGGVGLRHITKGNLESILIPLPPLNEQSRIVAKVDELMVLCDRLELQQKERETRHAALICAAVARFDEVPTPASLTLLFHGSYSIAPIDLRRAILKLAVRGKLVPQNVHDENVDELVRRVSEERRRLKRKNSTDDARTSSSDKSLGYDIPESWRWENLGNILIFGPTNGFSPKSVEYETRVRSLTLTATTSGCFKGEHVKFVPIDVPPESDLWLQDGDILVQRGNTLEYVGVSAVYRGERNAYIYPDLMMKLRVSTQLDVSFVHLAMSAAPSREFLRTRASGTSGSMPKINQATLTSLPIPIPPLLEQRRIVAKVEELMNLVDQLEAQLKVSQAIARELFDAVVHDLLHRTADLIKFPQRESDRASQRAAIGCYAIKQLVQSPNFGRTMLMKVCYLSEAYLGLSLGWQPMRQAAGPYDPEIEKFESLAKRSGWFTVTEKSLKNGHTKVEYHANPGLKAKVAEAIAVLGDQKTECDRLLNLFADRNTEEAEIIATLFAAWNDFLIDGKSPSDDEIIREVRENWHSKKERFAPARLAQWLRWLREHKLIPVGNPPRTRQQLSLALI